MPDPLKKLHQILWARQDGVPNDVEYKILVHVAADPNARVYLEPGNDYYAGVDNSNGVPGWVSKRKSIARLLCGRHGDWKAWVELDTDAPRKPGDRLRAHKITEAGFEAIAQHDARHEYDKQHLALARRLLDKYRKAAQDLKPK